MKDKKRADSIGMRIPGYETKSDEWKAGMLAGYDLAAAESMDVFLAQLRVIRENFEEAYVAGLEFGEIYGRSGSPIMGYKGYKREKRKKDFTLIYGGEDE